jgi:glycosyltransferase involved in cell wall biosynthesis
MDISIISDQSQLAFDINQGLKSLGHKTKLVTVDTSGDSSDVVSITRQKGRFLWLKTAIRSFFYRFILLRVDNKYQFYKDINENNNYYKADKFISIIGAPDCILILFDYRLLTTKTIKEIYEATGSKIIWLLSDMSPFTGGCSYSWECDGYTRMCENCPAIRNPMYGNFAKNTLKAKLNNLNNVDLHVVAFSSQQLKQVQLSSFSNSAKIHSAYFPIDYKIFKPVNRESVLRELGLTVSDRYFLIGANNLKEQRKGIPLLLKALKNIEMDILEANIVILIAGTAENIVREQNYKFPCKFFGLVNFKNLAQLYQASDLFICPTLADSGPTMINQSILCGTPVVSFDIGVANDLVKDFKSGFIAKSKDSEALASAILCFINLTSSQIKYMSDECMLMREKIIKDDFLNKFPKDFLM